MSVRKSGFKCIGRIGDEYHFADSVFKHGGDFQGVTGSVIRPVSKAEYYEATSRESVEERLRDAWACMEKEGGEDDFQTWVDEVITHDGAESVMFDESDCCDAEAAFDEMGIEYECTDCTGGGRIFGDADGRDKFYEVFDQEALDAINDFEEGRGELDYVAGVIFGK